MGVGERGDDHPARGEPRPCRVELFPLEAPRPPSRGRVVLLLFSPRCLSRVGNRAFETKRQRSRTRYDTTVCFFNYIAVVSTFPR